MSASSLPLLPQGRRSKPLAGRTVAVTRPAAQAGPLIEHLSVAGARVVHVALIAIAPASDGGAAIRSAWNRLTEFAWVVLTSVNGIDALAAVAAGPLPEPPRWAAVGASTAEALADLGRPPSLVPCRQDGIGLAAEMPVAAAGGRVLLLQAEVPSSGWEDELSTKGWDVERVVAYRTVPAEPTEAHLEELASADVVTLASPSAAANLARLGRTDVRSVCIGPSTAAAAREHGIPVVGTAADPSPAAFTSAVISAVGLAS